MLTTIQVVFIFCGFLLQQRCSAEESYGYVVNEQFKPGESVLEMTLSQLQQMFMSGGGDTNDTTQSRDECMASARAYLCKKTFQFNNQCANEHSIQDRESIEETCKKARMDCSANATDVQISFINVLFNCSMPIEKIEPTKQVKCERFPEVKDDPFPCAERKYKVFSPNVTDQAKIQLEAHKELERYASNISEGCLKDVSQLICKAVAAACNRKETTVVALLSRQDCEKTITCLNTTSEIKKGKLGFLGLCRNLPDAKTAKKIPLSLLFLDDPENDGNIKASPASANITRITQNKTAKFNTGNATEELNNKPTISYQNYTDQTTKPMSMRKITFATLQGQSSKPNAKIESTSEIPKAVSRPITRVQTNFTTQEQTSKSNATFESTTELPMAVNLTTPKLQKETKSVPSLKPTTGVNMNSTREDEAKTELSKTPQLIATSLPAGGRGNTTDPSRLNNTTTDKSTTNTAVQFESKISNLAVLIITFLVCIR